MLTSFLPLALLGLTSVTLAHPVARSEQEISFHKSAKRSLAGCHSSLRKRGMTSSSAARRAQLARRARAEMGIPESSALKRRDFDTALNTSHASNLSIASPYVRPESLFDANSSCVLVPEVTQGPYYVADEYVRFDLTEDQEGVPLWLDLELIDVNTCEPIDAGAYVDIWAANATGVYSGVSAGGNFESDDSNLDTTFLRGLQATNDDGFVQFKTIFPGHYTGRAIHIHMAVHSNGTYNMNGTYSGEYMSHVGQLFFDQDLISQVEATAAYSANTQTLTDNSDDDILESEADGYDPMVEYVLLGEDVSDGILGWAAIGIDATASSYSSPAAWLTEDGGVENEDFDMGGGGGAGGPPDASGSGGGMGGPSGSAGGAMPSGTGAPQ